MDAKQAQERLSKLKVIGRVLLWGLTGAVAVAGVLKIGTDSDWVFLRDIGGPIASYHWGEWQAILATLAAAFAGAAAISFGVRYVQIKQVLTELIQNTSVTNVYNDNSNNDHSAENYFGADDAVMGEVSRIREEIKSLDERLADKQADPLHLAQIEHFLDVAKVKKIAEYRAQLEYDAKLYERFRVLMSELAQECEAARDQSRSFG